MQTPDYQTDEKSNWNSDYWQQLGAPWGGMFSTCEDFAIICQLLLNKGTWAGARLLSPASVRAMTTNRLLEEPNLPEAEARTKPWGLGWRGRRCSGWHTGRHCAVPPAAAGRACRAFGHGTRQLPGAAPGLRQRRCMSTSAVTRAVRRELGSAFGPRGAAVLAIVLAVGCGPRPGFPHRLRSVT